jgi:hypothetical protein
MLLVFTSHLPWRKKPPLLPPLEKEAAAPHRVTPTWPSYRYADV